MKLHQKEILRRFKRKFTLHSQRTILEIQVVQEDEVNQVCAMNLSFNSGTDELFCIKWELRLRFSIVSPHRPYTLRESYLVLSPDISEITLVHECWQWDECGCDVDPGKISMETTLKETWIKLDLGQMDSVKIGASDYQSRLEEVIAVIIFSFILYIS